MGKIHLWMAVLAGGLGMLRFGEHVVKLSDWMLTTKDLIGEQKGDDLTLKLFVFGL